EQVRTIVAKLIDRTWPDEFGNHCKADMAAVDGNYLTDDVYLLVKRFPSFRAIMVRGNPRPQGTYLKQVSEQKTGGGKVRKYGKRFYNLDVGVLKVRLYRDVARQDRDEPGYVHFPRGFEQDFFEQLVAENRIAKIDKTGNRYFAWDLPNGKRNEMLDCANYAFAAFIRMGGLGFTTETWDKLEAERNVVPDHPQRDFEELLTPVAQTPADEPAHPASESLAERLARLARAQNGQT
ncbi:MAG: terminase gpA endonuclease subunit, partial [Pseudomonadota bacterium]